MNKEALINALKELGRVVLLAVIPLLVSSLENGWVDWRAIAVVAGLAALRFVDKYLHEVGKERSTPKSESRLLKGLTRF
jgi:hypothetical protein